jgi:hypothetical protein
MNFGQDEKTRLSRDIQDTMGKISEMVDNVNAILCDMNREHGDTGYTDKQISLHVDSSLNVDTIDTLLQEIEFARECEAEARVTTLVTGVPELEKKAGEESNATLNNTTYNQMYRKYMHALEATLSQIEDGDNTNEIKGIMDLYANATKIHAKHTNMKAGSKHADALLERLLALQK